MFPIKNVEYLRKLNAAVSLEIQVKAVRQQDKLREQNFLENLEKAVEPVTKSYKQVSEEVTKTKTGNCIKNNQASENLNNKLLQKMNDRGILASYLMTPLSKITYPENTSQFRLLKDYNSNKVGDLLIKSTIPITLHDNLLTLRDTGKVFELKGDLLKMITNNKYNVYLASLSDKKQMYNFAKEMNFDVRGQGRKSTRDRTLINLIRSPAIMAI